MAHMKKRIAIISILALLLCGCSSNSQPADIAATTLPVYQFTAALCDGTGLQVVRLVTESVSCLHDYSLNVRQVKAAQGAELVVISGAGLEDFMEDVLTGKKIVDASAGLSLLESCHDHDHGEGDHDGHEHEADAHIWLSPENAMVMARNIRDGLKTQYPPVQRAV